MRMDVDETGRDDLARAVDGGAVDGGYVGRDGFDGISFEQNVAREARFARAVHDESVLQQHVWLRRGVDGMAPDEGARREGTRGGRAEFHELTPCGFLRGALPSVVVLGHSWFLLSRAVDSDEAFTSSAVTSRPKRLDR